MVEVTKEDLFDGSMILIFIASIIGIIDGLTEDIMIEAFLWSGVFFFGFIAFLIQLFHNKKIALGLSLMFFGSFLGIMQTIFYFIYGIMRQFPQGDLQGRIWIIPEVVWSIKQFWFVVIIGYVMIIIGYYLLKIS